MRNLSQIIPLFFCLAACQSNSDTPATTPAVTTAAAPAAPAPAPIAAAPANAEHIDATTFSIIGLPDEQLTTKQLTRQLGRPDSIAKGAVECGSRLHDIPMDNPDGDFWYYGKTMYEVNGTQAILCSFDVTSGRFRGKIGKLVLDKNTTLEDVRRFYPESAKEADKPAGPGSSGEVMGVPFFDKDVPLDESLDLIFQKGRLQAVEFFSPC